MLKKYLIILCFIPIVNCAQMMSNINIDSGSNNQITIKQQGADSTKNSNVKLKHGDSNQINVNQSTNDSLLAKHEEKGFWGSANHFGLILTIIIGIITIIGFIKGWFKRK